jgi:SAM-dependent methyltransferase
MLSTHPLDFDKRGYSYVERSNPAILNLLLRHVIRNTPKVRILDIGCGCGVNAHALKQRAPTVWVTGIEPNARAAELAQNSCNEVFTGRLQDWVAAHPQTAPFDALVLSDVLEHIEYPVPFVREILAAKAVRNAIWIVSVPNYAVWYNRLRTVAGVQGYGWSGLWDRTHVRFYTHASARELLEYCGLRVIEATATPSLVQCMAPVLRKLFEGDVDRGEHLALSQSTAYRLYRSVVEPAECKVCAVWPELLGFQAVFAAKRAANP